MALTGTSLLVVVCAVAALSAAAVVWAAPRPGVRAPVRAAMLLGSQLCVLIALLAALNDYFTFYGAWDELVGVSAGHGGSSTGAPTAARAGRGPAPGGTPAATRAAARRAAVPVRDAFVRRHRMPPGQGRLEAVVIHGARSGITARAYVYLPQQYFQDRTRRFPVALTLTGYPGNAQNLITRLRVPAIAAGEIAAGRIQPMIFVMMRPMLTPPRDTECTDVPAGPQAETFFAQDVPVAIGAAFRTAPGPAGWSTIGDSTGGYCALKLAMRHSDRYGAAVSLAGYYTALRDFTTGDLYGGSRAYRRLNDLAWRLRHLPAPPVDVLVTTSRVGERDYPQTLRFIALVHAPMRVASITLPSGGHHFGVWQRELTPALRWLSARLSGGPRPPQRGQGVPRGMR